LALAPNVAILTTWGSFEALPFAMSAAVIGESGFLPSHLWKVPLQTWIAARKDGFLFCGHSLVF